MRSFPRTRRHRVSAALATTTLALGALSVPGLAPSHAEPDLKHEHKKVQGRIDHAEHDFHKSSQRLLRATYKLEASRKRLDAAKAKLNGARGKLGDARQLDREMQAELEAAKERLYAARTELRTGREAVEVQRLGVVDTVTSIYMEGDPELLAFASILDAQTPADLTRRMGFKNVVVGRETRAYDDLHAAEVLLEVDKEKVLGAKAEVADKREAAADHLVTMRALHEETRQAKVEVRELVTSRRDLRKAANQARKHDQKVLAKLRQQEARIKARILEAARRAALSGAGYRGDAGGFLMRPVDGYVTSPFGYRNHPIYGYWGLHDGTDFGAACGTPLRAVSSGTVMSRYYSGVYGNRLYLNVGQVNGKNLTAVYNHLSGYNASPGQRVSRGDVIGWVGNTGWSTGCHLHFSVLVNGNPVNPATYF